MAIIKRRVDKGGDTLIYEYVDSETNEVIKTEYIYKKPEPITSKDIQTVETYTEEGELGSVERYEGGQVTERVTVIGRDTSQPATQEIGRSGTKTTTPTIFKVEQFKDGELIAEGTGTGTIITTDTLTPENLRPTARPRRKTDAPGKVRLSDPETGKPYELGKEGVILPSSTFEAKKSSRDIVIQGLPRQTLRATGFFPVLMPADKDTLQASGSLIVEGISPYVPYQTEADVAGFLKGFGVLPKTDLVVSYPSVRARDYPGDDPGVIITEKSYGTKAAFGSLIGGFASSYVISKGFIEPGVELATKAIVSLRETRYYPSQTLPGYSVKVVRPKGDAFYVTSTGEFRGKVVTQFPGGHFPRQYYSVSKTDLSAIGQFVDYGDDYFPAVVKGRVSGPVTGNIETTLHAVDFQTTTTTKYVAQFSSADVIDVLNVEIGSKAQGIRAIDLRVQAPQVDFVSVGEQYFRSTKSDYFLELAEARGASVGAPKLTKNIRYVSQKSLTIGLPEIKPAVVKPTATSDLSGILSEFKQAKLATGGLPETAQINIPKTSTAFLDVVQVSEVAKQAGTVAISSEVARASQLSKTVAGTVIRTAPALGAPSVITGVTLSPITGEKGRPTKPKSNLATIITGGTVAPMKVRNTYTKTGAVPVNLIKTTQITGISSKSGMATALDLGTGSTSQFKQDIIQRQIVATKLDLGTEFVQRTIQKTKLRTPITPNIPTFTGFDFGIGPPRIPILKPPRFGGKMPKLGRGFGFRMPKIFGGYMPSLGGVFLGKRGKGKIPGPGKLFSGLELTRPVFRRRKRGFPI